ncbi:MAG: hypothetical protein QOI22_510 [Verrucomicrobiota bacterium]|jgi:hypothetical protein
MLRDAGHALRIAFVLIPILSSVAMQDRHSIFAKGYCIPVALFLRQ